MANCTELVRMMGMVSINATEAKGPVHVSFGRVLSVSPLSVLVDQKLTLGAAQLVLTRNVTDYEIQLSMEQQDFKLEENSSGSDYLVSSNQRVKIMIHNALETGEEIVLLRQQGGQKYIIIDRVVSV